MNRVAAVRWWPLLGVSAMALLGLSVGKGSTGLDDVFLDYGEAHPWVERLLLFTDARLVISLYAVTVVAAAFQRRWPLAVAAAVTPVVAVVAVRLLKRAFGRELVGALAYPSGHLTVTVVVLGMLVLVAGSLAWMKVAAILITLGGMLGLSFTFHYFTDTIGALFLGTSLLCLALRAVKLDRCQPRCDLDHSTR